MLFTFGKVWKYTCSIIFGWVLYGLFGFEFTAVTLLSIMVAALINSPTVRL